jgi:hypothetical protein
MPPEVIPGMPGKCRGRGRKASFTDAFWIRSQARRRCTTLDRIRAPSMGRKAMGTPRVETNLQFASMRQIHAAIEHMERGDFECATTLADAAKRMLAYPDELHLLQVLNGVGRSPEITVSAAVNGRVISNQSLEKTIITDVQVIAAIRRAIARFLAAFPEVKTPQMRSFAQRARFDLAAGNEWQKLPNRQRCGRP